VALDSVELGQIVQAHGNIGVLVAEDPFVDRERAPEKWLGQDVATQRPVKSAQIAQKRCGSGVIRA